MCAYALEGKENKSKACLGMPATALGADRQSPGTHWLASLPSFLSIERHCLKAGMQRAIEEDPMSCSGLCMHTQRHTNLRT